jgi:inositol 3-alpha-galactosyltransferase
MAPVVPVDVFTGTGKVSTLNAGYSKRAYITFLAGNGDYVKGVVGLAKGLRKVKSAYPLVVAMLPDVPEEHRQILRSQGCIIREIEPIYPPENQVQFAMAYYVINYSKLRIWNVSNYNFIYIYFSMDVCMTRRTCMLHI